MPKGLKFAAISALSLSLAGFSAVSARAAGQTYDVTFDNMSTSFYSLNVKVPKIEVKGSSASKADLEKMFSQDISLADQIKALRAFSATSIDIPAITANFSTDLFKFDTTVNNVKFVKVADGKIGQLSYPEAVLSFTAGEEKTALASASYKIKGFQINDYNLVHQLRLIFDKAGPDDKEMVPLYRSAITEGITVNSRTGSSGVSSEVIADYGKITMTSGAKVKLLSRPIKDVVFDIIDLSLAMQKNEKTPENLAKMRSLGLLFIEMVENYQTDSYVGEAMTFSQSTTMPNQSSPMKLSMRIGKYENTSGLFQMKDVSYDLAGQMKLGIGSLSLKGLSLAPFLEVSKKLLANPGKYSEKDLVPLVTSLYAEFGTLSLDNVSVKGTLPSAKKAASIMPDMDDEDDEVETPKLPAPQQSKPVAGTEVDLKIKNITLRSEKAVNGLPSSVRFSMDNVQMPLSSLQLDKRASATAKALGYESLDISYAFDMYWNKDKNELIVNEISGSERNSGSYLIKGIVGNVTQNVFTNDPRVIGMALTGLTAKDVSIHLEDKGLFDRAVAVSAQQQGVTADQVKAFMPFMLESIPQPLGGTNAVGTIKKALLQYIQKPGKLDISIKAKNPKGLGLVDFMGLSKNPLLIDEMVSVTATATK